MCNFSSVGYFFGNTPPRAICQVSDIFGNTPPRAIFFCHWHSCGLVCPYVLAIYRIRPNSPYRAHQRLHSHLCVSESETRQSGHKCHLPFLAVPGTQNFLDIFWVLINEKKQKRKRRSRDGDEGVFNKGVTQKWCQRHYVSRRERGRPRTRPARF